MSDTHERMIRDAKRTARRLSRTRSESYQECLDIVARAAGRRNWSAFLADPVDVRTIHETSLATSADADVNSPSQAIAPILAGSRLVAEYNPRPGSPLGQDGIVLGLEEKGLVRTGRRASVLCIGDHASGKTTGIALTTIAASPDASQIVHDPRSELLKTTLTRGWRDHAHILTLDPTADAARTGATPAAFNPLHPAFWDGDDPWRYAQSVAATLIPLRSQSSYFDDRSRRAMAAMLAFLLASPSSIPDDGRPTPRIASLPALADWMATLRDHGMESILLDASDATSDAGLDEASAELSGLSNLWPRERAGVLGTIDQALLPARNARIRRHLDPIDPEDGSALVRAFADPTAPTTTFLTSSPADAAIAAPLAALALQTIGRWRSRQGPSFRSLQMIVDEADAISPSPFIRSSIAEGVPHGTSLLVVHQTLEPNRLPDPWVASYEASSGIDHVVSVASLPSRAELDAVSSLLGRRVEVDEIVRTAGLQAVVSRTGSRILATPRPFQAEADGR